MRSPFSQMRQPRIQILARDWLWMNESNCQKVKPVIRQQTKYTMSRVNSLPLQPPPFWQPRRSEKSRGNRWTCLGELSSWDLSSVTKMQEMFRDASSFNQYLSPWDVSAVTASYMFEEASLFNQYLSSRDVSSVTNMDGVFHKTAAFNGDLASWNVSAIATMERTFYNA